MTLDLGGHAVVGSGAGTAVAIRGRGITVRNGSIRGFTDGVAMPFDGTTPTRNAVLSLNTTVSRFDITGCGAGDVVAFNHFVSFIGGGPGPDPGTAPMGCEVAFNTSATGALEFVTIRNRIEYNDVKALDVGAFFRGGPVPGSVIVHNRATRLMVDLAAGSTIEDNVINGSVSLSASTGLSFRGNTILGGGLNLDGVSSSVVWANVIRRAPADGISLTGPVVFDHDAFTTAHNLLLRNTVARSARNGIFLQATAPGSVGASGTVVRGNRVHDNGGDGIHVEAPSTTAVRNVANHNAGVGINAPPGIVDGGANRARANGVAQCVNLVCLP